MKKFIQNFCPNVVLKIFNKCSLKLFTLHASSPKPLGRLEPNLAGMFLGWSCTKLLFFVPVGYSIWLPRPLICSDWLKFQRAIVHLDLRSRWTNKKYIMLNDFIVRHKSTFSDFMEIYVWKNLYRIFVRM
jgi:hypothetical protein